MIEVLQWQFTLLLELNRRHTLWCIGQAKQGILELCFNLTTLTQFYNSLFTLPLAVQVLSGMNSPLCSVTVTTRLLALTSLILSVNLMFLGSSCNFGYAWCQIASTVEHHHGVQACHCPSYLIRCIPGYQLGMLRVPKLTPQVIDLGQIPHHQGRDSLCITFFILLMRKPSHYSCSPSSMPSRLPHHSHRRNNQRSSCTSSCYSSNNYPSYHTWCSSTRYSGQRQARFFQNPNMTGLISFFTRQVLELKAENQEDVINHSSQHPTIQNENLTLASRDQNVGLSILVDNPHRQAPLMPSSSPQNYQPTQGSHITSCHSRQAKKYNRQIIWSYVTKIGKYRNE